MALPRGVVSMPDWEGESWNKAEHSLPKACSPIMRLLPQLFKLSDGTHAVLSGLQGTSSPGEEKKNADDRNSSKPTRSIPASILTPCGGPGPESPQSTPSSAT